MNVQAPITLAEASSAVAENVVKPQKGPQEAFLSTPADICIYGGAAGGGKTFALLMEPLRHVETVPGFSAVIFRRTMPQIVMAGGMWEVSTELYKGRGRPREHVKDWRFPNGGRVTFAHIEYERDRFAWDGAQIPLVCFDQLEHFTQTQFFYLLGRNRSTCGVRPYMRATCNPDPNSFLATFLEWWICQESGYPIPERSGIMRYFVRRGDDELVWASNPTQLYEAFPNQTPLSVTFIASKIDDNQILMEIDPGYLAKLEALPKVERERQRHGNWKIKPAAGLYFQRAWTEVIDGCSEDGQSVRVWDLAATKALPNTDPDWTRGVRMKRLDANRYVIEDVKSLRDTPRKVMEFIRATAEADGENVQIGLFQDPGQAGKWQVQDMIGQLSGFTAQKLSTNTGKITAFSPLSSQMEAGNVAVIRGRWNDAFFDELENFPEGVHDDQVDASAGAFKFLQTARTPNMRAL